MRRPPSTAMVVVFVASNKSSQSPFTLTTLDQRLDDIIHVYTPNDGIVIDLILRMLRRTRWGHCGYCIIHGEIVNNFDT
jgi:hypothetical protein